MPALASSSASGGVAQLQEALQQVGYPGGFSDLVLYPGHQRHTLIKWIVSRLLGGRALDELHSRAISEGASLDVGSEEERFAKKCDKLLHVLGVTSSVDAIRGCGSEQQRLQLLLDLLQLLAAAAPYLDTTSSSTISHSSSSPGGPPTALNCSGSCQAAAGMEGTMKLLEHVCGSAAKLCGESVQLFPADLARVLERYSVAGATLPQQQVALNTQLAPLAAKLAALQAAAEPPAAGEAWDGAFGALQGALERFLGDAHTLTGLYRRELSVWSEDASTRGPIDGPAADIGAAAKDVGAAYQDLRTLLEAAQSLTAAHGALTAAEAGLGGANEAPLQGLQQQHLAAAALAGRQEALQLAQARQVLLDAAALNALQRLQQ